MAARRRHRAPGRPRIRADDVILYTFITLAVTFVAALAILTATVVADRV